MKQQSVQIQEHESEAQKWYLEKTRTMSEIDPQK